MLDIQLLRNDTAAAAARLAARGFDFDTANHAVKHAWDDEDEAEDE